MACIRNLRNLILAGIDNDHVQKVCSYIRNEKAVIGSRMFPFRFYTAFDVLDDLDAFAEKELERKASRTRNKVWPILQDGKTTFCLS